MMPETTLYLILLFIIGLSSLMIGLLALRQSETPGYAFFSAMLIGLAVWALGYGIEIQLANSYWAITDYLFLYKLKYLGIVFIPVFWLLYTLEYTGHKKYTQLKYAVFLLIVPAITLSMLSTNDVHQLFYYGVEVPSETGAFIIAEHSAFYVLHTVYSYALIFLGMMVLLHSTLHRPKYYKSRIYLVFVGICLTWLCNIIAVANLIPNLEFDVTPLLFLISDIILYAAIFSFNDSDIMPVAKKTLIELMDDGVFILDRHNKIIEINPAARNFALLALKGDLVGKDSLKGINGKENGSVSNGRVSAGVGSDPRIEGQKISSIFSGIDEFLNETTREKHNIISFVGKDKVEYFFDIVVRPILSNSKVTGSLVIMNDISEYKRSEKALIASRKKYHSLYNNITDGIVIHSGYFNSTKIYEVNDILLDMVGYTREELLSMNIQEIYNEAAMTKDFEHIVQEAKKGNAIRYNTFLTIKNGTRLPVQINSRMFKSFGEDRIITLVRDRTTEHKMREVERDSLMQIEKNIEQLSILNDHIRNPLMVISGNCFLSEGCPNSDTIVTQIQKIDDVVKLLDIRCTESESIREFIMSNYSAKSFDE